MNYIKKISKSLLYTFIPMLLAILLLTILNYFNILSYNKMSLIKNILFIVFIIINSYLLGFKSKTKGYIEGIKYGFIIILILAIGLLIFKGNFSFNNLIYYSIILTSSIFSSIIGKNKQRT